MDFNINNETFGEAYVCLVDANYLLEVGLGDRKNNDRFLSLIYKCTKLKNNMYNTIKYLSMMDSTAEDFLMIYLMKI